MLAVFKKFLDNPDIFTFLNLTGDGIKRYFPPNLTADANLLRWHITMFLSEFVIDEQLIGAWATDDLYIDPPIDRLTWSGYKVFCELQDRAKHNPQQN